MKTAFAWVPALVAASALAAPAARAAAPANTNIVTVNVADVAAPATLPGLCRMRGQVISVMDGQAYRPGQAITLTLPCARSLAELRNGYNLDMVRRAKFVAAQVDAQGRVVAPGALVDFGGFLSRDPLVFIEVQPAA